MESKNLTRNHAVKITISQLLAGTYIQEIEQNPNYLLTTNNQKVYRLNVIATIIQKETIGTITNLTIDDSSATILTRFFEENKFIHQLNVGDVILIIGKLRTFNQDKYISPEIVKKIDILWLKHRFLELKHEFVATQTQNNFIATNTSHPLTTLKNEKNISSSNSTPSAEEIFEDEISPNLNNKKLVIEDKLLPFQKIAQLIKELDLGEGVLIEEIIEKSPLEHTEQIIEKMLQNGDIFQNHPGKIKVL